LIDMHARSKVVAAFWLIPFLLVLLVPVPPAVVGGIERAVSAIVDDASPPRAEVGRPAPDRQPALAVRGEPYARAGAEAFWEESFAAAQLRFMDAGAPAVVRQRRTHVAGHEAMEIETSTDGGRRLLVWIVDVDGGGLVVQKAGVFPAFGSARSRWIAEASVASVEPD
jgi:hypothetical protein